MEREGRSLIALHRALGRCKLALGLAEGHRVAGLVRAGARARARVRARVRARARVRVRARAAAWPACV